MADRTDVVLATTTSARDAGLLEVLLADSPQQANADGAGALREHLGASETQRAIGEFGREQ